MFNTLNHTTALYETSYEVVPAHRTGHCNCIHNRYQHQALQLSESDDIYVSFGYEFVDSRWNVLENYDIYGIKFDIVYDDFEVPNSVRHLHGSGNVNDLIGYDIKSIHIDRLTNTFCVVASHEAHRTTSYINFVFVIRKET